MWKTILLVKYISTRPRWIVFKSPAGSGSVFDLRIRIQQVKFSNQKSPF